MSAYAKPHAVVIPFPVQGHINPMLHLAKKLVSHGFVVTFINTDYTHHRMLQAYAPPNHKEGTETRIHFRAIPDGLPQFDTRTNFAQLARSMENTMRPTLHKIIQEINHSEVFPVVTCLIADFFAVWALDVAEDLNIPAAVFWSALIATYAIIHHIPLLISKGIIPSNGMPKENTMVEYLPSMPCISSANLPWLIGRQEDREFRFQFWVRNMFRLRRLKWILCNSFQDLELPIINMFPREVGICPIGPLTASHNILPARDDNNYYPSLWKEESECLQWLDMQPSVSVIYVSFGSFAILKEKQVGELALGLEATQQPFLWVVRSDLVERKRAVLPAGFLERITSSGWGCIVSWASQISVLSHPSIACFVTHCGWNSTMESITAGVPMLCWPYYADQFLNCAYIVHVWKIGLALNPNKEGTVEREEIRNAVQKALVGEDGVEMKKRVAKLKEASMAAVDAGGSSYFAFSKFLADMNIDRSSAISD